MAGGRYPDDIDENLAARRLTYIDGASRKEYRVTIARDLQDQYVVIGGWGRIGSVSQHKVYSRTTDAHAAVTAANRLMDSKVTRGYADNGSDPAPFVASEVLGGRIEIAVDTLQARPAASLAEELFA